MYKIPTREQLGIKQGAETARARRVRSTSVFKNRGAVFECRAGLLVKIRVVKFAKVDELGRVAGQ